MTMPKNHPWIQKEIKTSALPSRYYRDPALNAKLKGDRCDGCEFEKGKWDSWAKEFYFVCLKGKAHGSRCANYKKGML